MSNQCRGMLFTSGRDANNIPPPHYKCSKCGMPGHYVSDCQIREIRRSLSDQRPSDRNLGSERVASASVAYQGRSYERGGADRGVGIVPTDLLAHAVAHAKASAAAAAAATAANTAPAAGREEEVMPVNLVAQALAHAKATAARLGALTSAKRNAEAAAAASEEQANPPPNNPP